MMDWVQYLWWLWLGLIGLGVGLIRWIESKPSTVDDLPKELLCVLGGIALCICGFAGLGLIALRFLVRFVS